MNELLRVECMSVRSPGIGMTSQLDRLMETGMMIHSVSPTMVIMVMSCQVSDNLNALFLRCSLNLISVCLERSRLSKPWFFALCSTFHASLTTRLCAHELSSSSLPRHVPHNCAILVMIAYIGSTRSWEVTVKFGLQLPIPHHDWHIYKNNRPHRPSLATGRARVCDRHMESLGFQVNSVQDD